MVLAGLSLFLFLSDSSRSTWLYRFTRLRKSSRASSISDSHMIPALLLDLGLISSLPFSALETAVDDEPARLVVGFSTFSRPGPRQ